MPKALLVGIPNSGKTALFNRLTGLKQPDRWGTRHCNDDAL